MGNERRGFINNIDSRHRGNDSASNWVVLGTKRLKIKSSILLLTIYWLVISSGCRLKDTETNRTDILKPSDNYELGSMYLVEGDVERAIGQFVLAIRKDKNYVDAYGGLGTAYFLRGNNYCLRKDYDKCTQDHQNAVKAYMQAMKLNEKFEYAYFGIGRVLFVRWQLEKNYKWVKDAIKYLETAYKLNNKRVITAYYLGLCYLAENKIGQAKIYLEEYLNKVPDAANAELVKQFLNDIKNQTTQDKYSKILQDLEKEYLEKENKK